MHPAGYPNYLRYLPRGCEARLFALSGLAIWLLIAAPGCQKKDAGPQAEEMPAPISKSEAERGVEACRAYVQRVCACAEAKPDNAELEELCYLAPAKARSVDMVLEVNLTTKDGKERVATRETARRIVSSCIEEQGMLDGKGCPR